MPQTIYLNNFKCSQRLKQLEKGISFQTWFDAHSCCYLFTENAELLTSTLDAS